MMSQAFQESCGQLLTAKTLTHTEGVSWFAVGVGPDAELGLQSLCPVKGPGCG